MGEYTAFNMKCELKKDIPQQVIETLEFMVDPNKDDAKKELFNPPAHLLFQTRFWETILKTSGGGLWDVGSTLTYTQDTNTYTLHVRTTVKDHEYQVVSFLHWIAPYSNTEGFVGTSHPDYEDEECRILFEKGRAFLVNPVENLGIFYTPEEEYNRNVEGLANATNQWINTGLNFWEKLEKPDSKDTLKRIIENMRHENPDFEQMLNEPRLKKFKKIVDKLYGKTSDEGETPPE